MRAGLIQMTSSDDPAGNLEMVTGYVTEAVRGGADIVLTPEVTNCISASRNRQNAVLSTEDTDPMLASLRAQAVSHRVHILIGSLALKTDDGAGRFANRSFLIGPDGSILARYDKIHMFDVTVSETETYRESAGYRPGNTAVIAPVLGITIGLSICYDIRFPHLYRRLAQAGAQVFTVPSAFSPVTGAAHWESLLRARAIECGAYVLAPSQTGSHSAAEGRRRSTHGHTIVVDPWGAVLADGGTEPGIVMADIAAESVADARARVPSLDHDRNFDGP
ncbi:MAG: carbon-nitrogen hydrolase family protein [Pseudomonadota bacterium]